MTEIITVPVAQLSALFNLTDRRVQQMAEENIIPKSDRGLYPLWPSITGYIKFLQDRMGGRKSSDDTNSERTRLLSAQAEKTELEVETIKRNLINADQVRTQDFTLAVILKNNLLSMPDRIAAIVAAETDAGAVHDLISDEVRHSLERVLEAMEHDEVDDAELDITRARASAELEKNND